MKSVFAGARTWAAILGAAVLAAVIAGGALLPAGCAKRGMPPGGPEDKTAPTVVEMTPASEAVRVDLASSISLTFSEVMKRRTVETAVVVSPPCKWAKRYWDEQTYVLVPGQPLQPQTTYLVSVGASATDRHGVKLGKTFVAGFSTGETIEAGVISGKVIWKAMSVEQAIVEVFDTGDLGADALSADTLTTEDAGEAAAFPAATPRYVSLSGAGGQFEIPFVNPRRTYRLLAFIDKDLNSEYDEGEIVGCGRGRFAFADSLRLAGIEIMLCSETFKGGVTGLVAVPAGLTPTGATPAALSVPAAPALPDTVRGAAPADSAGVPVAAAPKTAGLKTAVLAQALGDSAVYRTVTDDAGKFAITCMNPGRYLFEAFVDYNGNGRRDVVDTFYVELGDTVDIRPCSEPSHVEMRLQREDQVH